MRSDRRMGREKRDGFAGLCRKSEARVGGSGESVLHLECRICRIPLIGKQAFALRMNLALAGLNPLIGGI
jgi:hypothetical protein